jgi:hypothetical protein
MLAHPGRYGDPPSLRVWTVQLLSWMLVLVVMKAVVAVAIYLFRTPLGVIGSLLFYPVHHHPKVELLIVMIGCPLVMNMVQFWIQDSFLKDHGPALDQEAKPLHAEQKRYGSMAETKVALWNLLGWGGSKVDELPVLSPKKPVATRNKSRSTTAEDMYEDL